MTYEYQLIAAIVFLTGCIITLAAWCRDRYIRLESLVDKQSKDHREELMSRDVQRDELLKRVSKLEVSEALLSRCPYVACPLRRPRD